jgi:hypothetical protein
MSEFLPFWPKAAAMAYVANGTTVSIYSRALPTNGFTEVVAQMEIDGVICGDGNTDIDVYPQVSNDGVNWQELTSDKFTTVEQGGTTTYPVKEMKKISTVGAFMRFRIAIYQNGSSANAGGTLLVSAAGRS